MDKKTREAVDKIVRAYAQHIEKLIRRGWEPTFMSFMFNPLNGSPFAVGEQMRYEVERVYGWLLPRRCRHPTNTPGRNKPFFIACPDFPVPKYNRDTLSAISINDGRHLHALDLTPPWTRVACTLADLVTDHQSSLAGHDRPLSHVYAETMTGTPEQATGYVTKAIGRGRANLDELIIMPRAHGEARYGIRFHE